MKNTVVMMLALGAFIPSQVFAQKQVWVEAQVPIDANGVELVSVQGLLLADSAFSDEWGFFSFFQVVRSYAQIYMGPTYTPYYWLQFGLGFGAERASPPFRTGGFVWVGSDDLSFITIGEYGGGGFWYKSEFNWLPAKWVGLGAMIQHGLGVGPLVEINFPVIPIKVWAPLLVDLEGNVIVLPSLRFELGKLF